MDQKYIELLLRFYDLLKEYHSHEVVGIENVPKKGRCLIVYNHSLATYDSFLLCARIYLERARLVQPLIDRLFYKVPYLGEIMTYLGAHQGSPEKAEQLLRDGEIVSVAPGGMLEALRSSQFRYQIRWDKRKGFVKLAMLTGTPIVLVACPKADDLYDVTGSKLTEWVYDRFRVPLFLARGLGGMTPLPKPVHLVHFVDKPLKPPTIDPESPDFDAALEAFHAKIVERMEALMTRGVRYRGYRS